MQNLFLFIILFLFSFGIAQPPARFYTAFGGDGEDIGYAAKATPDHNYIIAGSSSSYGSSGNTDLYLLKLDSTGAFMWQKFIGGFGNDAGKSIILLPDSGFVIAGYTNSSGSGGYDAYLVRTDKNGNTIWQTTFGGPDWDFANDVVLSPDGNIVIVGYTSSFGNGKKDGFIAKYDLGGILIWQKLFGGGENDELRSVIKTSDNFLATVGYTESKNDINGDGYFIKLDLEGDTLFTKTFGGPYLDFANDIVQKSDGHYVICGAKTYSANSTTESLMYGTFADGVFEWENHYRTRPDDDAYVSLANSYMMPGLTAYVNPRSKPTYKMQVAIFVATPGGYPYLINESGGADDELVYSVEGTTDGGYICVGSTASFGSMGANIYFIKMDSTIINYSNNGVGIQKTENKNKPKILYKDDAIMFSFNGLNAESVSIYDLAGRLLNNYPVSDDQLHISIASYLSSVYFLKIIYKNGTIYNEKFIHK